MTKTLHRQLPTLTRWALLIGFLAVGASMAWAQQPPANEGFLPLSEVPAGEQIPAISLVASAYGFVWVAFIAYVWSLASRLKKVEREIGQLEQRGH
ncbi:MAG: CcmD family protein [Vicinamibacterales bacterium]